MEDKRYICRFCGTNATKTNSRGNCISCGAPIAMKDFVVEETPKMTYEELNDLKKRVTLLENLRKLRVLCGGIYEIESSVKGLAGEGRIKFSFSE